MRLWAAVGPCAYVEVLVRPEGLDPPAFRFEACRSIQLSYGRVLRFYYARISFRSPFESGHPIISLLGSPLGIMSPVADDPTG